MSRRNDRFANEDTPARRREARAKQTRQDVQDEIRKLSREEFEKQQARDWAQVRAYLEGKAKGSEESTTRRNPYDISHLIKGSKVAPDSRLGQNRKGRGNIQGRPPWA